MELDRAFVGRFTISLSDFLPTVPINWRFCQDHIMKHMVILSSLITWSIIQLKSGPASWVTLCEYYSTQTFQIRVNRLLPCSIFAEKFGRLDTWFIIASDRALQATVWLGWTFRRSLCVRARILQTSQCSLSDRAQWQEKVLGGKKPWKISRELFRRESGHTICSWRASGQKYNNGKKIHVLCAVIIDYSLKNRVMAHYLFGISWPIQESRVCARKKRKVCLWCAAATDCPSR